MNKKMISTIENEPENFIKYNNGISITGEVRDLGNKISIINKTTPASVCLKIANKTIPMINNTTYETR